MSIIVWDGKIVAADSYANDGHTVREVEKLWQYGNVVIGGVGLISDIYAMKDWVFKGRKPDGFPSVSSQSTFVYVTPARGLIRYTNKPAGIIHGFKACAFGSASDFAYGAMALASNLGLDIDAKQIVEAAAKYSADTGGSVSGFQVIRD